MQQQTDQIVVLEPQLFQTMQTAELCRNFTEVTQPPSQLMQQFWWQTISEFTHTLDKQTIQLVVGEVQPLQT